MRRIRGFCRDLKKIAGAGTFYYYESMAIYFQSSCTALTCGLFSFSSIRKSSYHSLVYPTLITRIRSF